MADISNNLAADKSEQLQKPQQKIKISKKVLLFIIFADLLFLSGVYYFFFHSNSVSQSDSPITRVVEKFNDSEEISPTPFPFQEMTIPYLRAQKYQSKLGEMVTQSEGMNSPYSAFLTSYQSDGLRINGLLTKPNSEMPEGGFPAIVFVHGYIPPASYSTLGPQYSDYVDYLSRSGFVVFKIDLRGHGDSEGEPGGAYYSADYIADTLNAYSALQNSDFVNPESVGLWGHSMAGNVVLRSFVAKQDIPAIVIWSGAVYTYEDMRKYGIQDNSYQRPSEDSERARERDRMREVHGDPADGGEFWEMVAPTNYLSGISGAVQINHAIDDNVVNIGYSRDLNSILDKTDIPHELNEYQSGGHNITGISFNQAMNNTVKFFNRYLK